MEAVGHRADQIAMGEIAQPGSAVQVEPTIQRKEVAAKSKLESIRKLGGMARMDPIMHAHATNPKILDILEGLIGSRYQTIRRSAVYEIVRARIAQELSPGFQFEYDVAVCTP